MSAGSPSTLSTYVLSDGGISCPPVSVLLQDRDNQYNIIHMIDYFYFRNHLCITFELMG